MINTPILRIAASTLDCDKAIVPDISREDIAKPLAGEYQSMACLVHTESQSKECQCKASLRDTDSPRIIDSGLDLVVLSYRLGLIKNSHVASPYQNLQKSCGWLPRVDRPFGWLPLRSTINGLRMTLPMRNGGQLSLDVSIRRNGTRGCIMRASRDNEHMLTIWARRNVNDCKPDLFVQFKSRLFDYVVPGDAFAAFRRWARKHLFCLLTRTDLITIERVSRADVKHDVLVRLGGEHDLTVKSIEQFTTHLDNKQVYPPHSCKSPDDFSGFSMGSKKALYLVMYDKGAERRCRQSKLRLRRSSPLRSSPLRSSPLKSSSLIDEQLERWNVDGLSSDAVGNLNLDAVPVRIWRIEWRFNRGCLNKAKVNNADDLLRLLPGLVEEAYAKKAVMRKRSKRNRTGGQRRCSKDPGRVYSKSPATVLWQTLQEATIADTSIAIADTSIAVHTTALSDALSDALSETQIAAGGGAPSANLDQCTISGDAATTRVRHSTDRHSIGAVETGAVETGAVETTPSVFADTEVFSLATRGQVPIHESESYAIPRKARCRDGLQQ